MTMSLSIGEHRISPEAVPAEIATMAAKELMAVMASIDSHMDLVHDIITPLDASHAQTVNFTAQTSQQIDRMYTLAPTTVSILDQLDGTELSDGFESFFPGFFTVNYCRPGQISSKHRDGGSEDTARLARIVGLAGTGRLVLQDPLSLAEVTTDELGAGSVYELANPAQKADRWPHYARNTGPTDRISLAYQINTPPQLPSANFSL
jgi:hypothetical protein